jgi:hypothetical protein
MRTGGSLGGEDGPLASAAEAAKLLLVLLLVLVLSLVLCTVLYARECSVVGWALTFAAVCTAVYRSSAGTVRTAASTAQPVAPARQLSTSHWHTALTDCYSDAR